MLCGCTGKKVEYKVPIMEDLSSDSLYWLKLEESQKNSDYFALDGEIYCGEVAYNMYPLKKVNFERLLTYSELF
jgi:hypothetical protein